MDLQKVKIIKLVEIKNKKGNILKIINKKHKYFKNFGEIYFSKIKKNKIKGWNLHKRFYCHITICYGDVFLRLKDRKSKIKNIQLSFKRPKLVIIPPKIWFSFKSKREDSMILNILSGIHNQKETLKKEISK